ncbi:ArsR/SmtB family transcription factor [Halobacteriales archaeon Cl-PHB]
MNDTSLDEAIDPADAFGALADDTRVEILRALWEVGDQTAPFSELRDAVGMADSGQFNYHLDKLTGTFVRKTDDGYELSHAGRTVVGGLLSGTYTMTREVDSIPLEEPCPFCGGDRTFNYEAEQVVNDCEGCGFQLHYDVPPGVFAGYDPAEFPAVAERYMRILLYHCHHRICPYCEGRTVPSLVSLEATADHDWDDLPMVEYNCQRCAQEVKADPGTALFTHPAVVAFYHDHGVDVRTDSIMQFVATDTDRTQFLDADRSRASVTFDAGDDALTLTVDADLEVQEIERS